MSYTFFNLGSSIGQHPKKVAASAIEGAASTSFRYVRAPAFNVSAPAFNVGAPASPAFNIGVPASPTTGPRARTMDRWSPAAHRPTIQINNSSSHVSLGYWHQQSCWRFCRTGTGVSAVDKVVVVDALSVSSFFVASICFLIQLNVDVDRYCSTYWMSRRCWQFFWTGTDVSAVSEAVAVVAPSGSLSICFLLHSIKRGCRYIL